MTDFKRDIFTGDLDISSGGVELIRGEEEVAQRLSLALSLNLGEWFLNKFDGLNWIRNPEENFPQSLRFMLGTKLQDTPDFIFQTLNNYITNLDFIKSVTATFTFNDKTREFIYSPTIVGITGTIVVFDEFQAQI